MTTPAPLDFESTSPEAATAGAVCTNCGQPIRELYYEAAGNVVCADCHAKLQAQLAPSSGRAGRFGKALGFGLVAAAAGSAIYYIVREVTGYEIGLIAILVGFMIGKAVFIGSGQRGGRKYQVLAVLLTYFAMASTYAPMALGELRSNSTSADSTSAQGDSTATSGDSARVADTAPTKPVSADSSKAGASEGGIGTILLGVGALLVLLASLPVLVGMSSIISIFILGFGLLQAWKMNKAISIAFTGPYQIAPVVVPPAAAT